MVTDAVKKAHNRQMLIALGVMGLTVIAAFVPAIIALFQDGVWYMNAYLRDWANPSQAVVHAHAWVALLLLGLLFAQVYLGATLVGASAARKKMHRMLGWFVVVPLLVATLITACWAQASELEHTGVTAGFIVNIFLAVLVLTESSLGLYYARTRERDEWRIDAHKDWMMWALVDCAAASGGTRATLYLIQAGFDCDPFLSDWPTVGAELIAFLVALFCLKTTGRFKHKANVFMLGLHALAVLGLAVTSILFSVDGGCPPVRLIVGMNGIAPTSIAASVFVVCLLIFVLCVFRARAQATDHTHA